MSAATTSRDWAALVGRVMLAAIFVESGFGKITGFAGTVELIARGGWPMPEAGAVVAILFELGGGLLLVAGFKARWVALAMAVFTVVAGIMFHNYWDAPAAQRTMQFIHFWKNIAMAGGLLMVYAFGPGRLSLDRT